MTVKSPIDYLLTPDENVCVRRPCSPFLTETVQEYQVPLQEENACDILPHVSSYIQNDSFKEDQTKHESKNTHTPLSSTNSIESPVGFNYPLSLFTGCRRVDMYHRFKKLSEGTYGEVYKAQCKDTAEIVALKHIKYHAKMWDEGFPLTSLREISILLELHHPNIVNVKEVVVGRNPNHVYMVMEYCEHELRTLLERNKPSFCLSECKRLLYQLLSAVEYLHSNWVIHRDLKTSNLLYSNTGSLKICDFGMSRKFGDPVETYTHNVVTLWYRAPELIFGLRQYDSSVDMWSVGCIMGEILLRRPLFDGKTETDMLDKIFRLCGTPSDEVWPDFKKLPAFSNSGGLEFRKHAATWRKVFSVPKAHLTDPAALSDMGLDLLQSLLCLDFKKRITAKQALQHPFFREKPLPQREHLMPTAPDSHVNMKDNYSPCGSSGSGDKQKDFFYNADTSHVFGGRVEPHRYLKRLKASTQKKTNY